ncbi:MAG: transglutaminase domain-containing protein [Deltaproteobacteria bacterium]|nr:transglutaminase domain-containing protein [Deltaproteobacteria bacterium]
MDGILKHARRAAVLASLLAFGCGGGASGEGDAGANGSDTSTGTGSDDARQALRDASLFGNVSFEDTADGGSSPAIWSCTCFGAAEGTDPPCSTATDDPAHGGRVLVLPPGCLAFQDETELDDSKVVRFDLFARGKDVQPAWFYLFAWDADDYVETLYGAKTAVGPGSWTDITSGLQPTAGMVRLRMVLYNSGTVDLNVDDLVVVQDQANPPPTVASLLRAEHHTELAYADAATEPGQIWVPLPLDHATQVPLYVELTVTPSSVVDGVEYVADDEKNWGAIVHLTQQGAADPVVISWKGVVLARAISADERPASYAKLGDPAAWLAATPVADAAYPGIAETAASLASTGDPAIDRMQAVIGWTSANMTGTGQLTALDATTVYETRVASCTGYANLAAALGRALEVPTRTVANYLVGMSQQTHYIDEFYLGDELGWRRVEPQATASAIPEGYGVVVRLDLPSDEASEANTDTGRWALTGVPLRSLVEPLAGRARMTPAFSTGHFPDCALCDNRAELQAALPADEALSVADVFDRARQLWQVDRQAYLDGGLADERMAIRRGFLDAASVSDVDAILSALE